MNNGSPSKIVCSRFNDKIKFKSNGRVNFYRIGSSRIDEIEIPKFFPIATDGILISSSDGVEDVRDFISNNKGRALLVLTLKEKKLLHPILVETRSKVYVFEKLFPIFSGIKYNSNIFKSYGYLCSLYEKILAGETKGISLGKYYSTKYLYKVERKLKIKNSLDKFFLYTYRSGYQEVFKLKEDRDDRTIVAFDFNSMFASCMLEKFMEPKSISFIDVKDLDLYEDALLYVTFYKPKNEFIKRYHPFKYTRLFNRFLFEMRSDSIIDVVIFKDELEYYEKHFEGYEIHGAISSNKMVKHPLSEEVKRLYKERVEAIDVGDDFKRGLTKFILSTIHSCTNQKKYIHYSKKTKSELKKHIEKEFLLSCESQDDLKKLNNYHGVVINESDEGGVFDAKFINLESQSNIYSLSSRITSRAELKMVKMIEVLLSVETLEICYCNTDSIHVSLKLDHMDFLFEKLKGVIGSEIGKLKIEAISEKGYWFDVGRYWLEKEGKITKFANAGFNGPGECEPFIFNRKVYYHVKGSVIDYSMYKFKNVFSEFSYGKILDIDTCRYSRYSMDDIKSIDVAKKTYQSECSSSRHYKINLIKSLPFKFRPYTR